MSRAWKLVVVACFVVGICSSLSDRCHALKLDREVLGLGIPDQEDQDSGSFNRRIAMSSPSNNRPTNGDAGEPEIIRSPVATLKLALRLLLQVRMGP